MSRPASVAFWSVAFWLVTLASTIPILATRYLPFTDLPEHVASMATLFRLGVGDSVAGPFVVAFGRSQYLLYHVVGAAMGGLVGDAVLGNRLLLAGVAIAWPLAFRSLLRALGRDERLALFAPMVFFNRSLAIGFLPYVAAVPLLLLALAFFVRHLDEPTRRRTIGLGVTAVALFYMHVSAWILFVAITAGLAFFVHARGWKSRGLLATRRELLRSLLPMMPSGIAAIAWWRVGSLVGGRAMSAESDVGRMGVVRSLRALPVWAFDIWNGHLDEVAAGLWWLAFALVIVFAGSRASHEPATAAPEASNRSLRWQGPILFVPLVATAAVYFATPFRVGNAGMLNVRLAPIFVLFAVLALPLAAVRRRANVPLAMAGVATLLMVATSTVEARATSREMLGDFDSLLAKIRPGARVVSLNFDLRSNRTHFWPYSFAAAYHRARVGGINSWSFTELDHWPVHYAPGNAPPVHAPFWTFDPCVYELHSDGAYYDYALVQGKVAPFEGRAGPTFTAVATAGSLTLYEKTKPDDEAAPQSATGLCETSP